MKRQNQSLQYLEQGKPQESVQQVIKNAGLATGADVQCSPPGYQAFLLSFGQVHRKSLPSASLLWIGA